MFNDKKMKFRNFYQTNIENRSAMEILEKFDDIEVEFRELKAFFPEMKKKLAKLTPKDIW